MLSVNLPGRTLPPGGSGSIVSGTNPFGANPGATLGLRYVDINISPSLTRHTDLLHVVSSTQTVPATHFSGSNGVVANPVEPILPLEIRNVGDPDGLALRRVGFRGGSYIDLPDILHQLGFTVTDVAGIRWFIKFHPPGYPEMATGAEVVSSRLLWTLGYNVPEYHVAYVRREQLTVGEGALVQPPGAYKRQMREKYLDLLFKYAPRLPDARARVVASRALVGAPLGPFRFSGTRPDDPNDIVPHEHRRELRGLLVFSAWLNHVKAQRASNTLDTLVRDADRAYVRHNFNG